MNIERLYDLYNKLYERNHYKTSLLLLNIGLGLQGVLFIYAMYIQIFSMFRLPYIYIACLVGGILTSLFARYKLMIVIKSFVVQRYSVGRHKTMTKSALLYNAGSFLLIFVCFAIPGNHCDMILTIISSLLTIIGTVLFFPSLTKITNENIKFIKAKSLYNKVNEHFTIN